MDAQVPIGPRTGAEASAVKLSPDLFAAAFPFHFAVGPDLRLVQAGRSLRRVAPEAVAGAPFQDLFRIVRPEGDPSFAFLQENQAQLFLLEHRGTSMRLRGEFIALPEGPWMVFLGSPWLVSASEITERGLSFNDFATHDPIVDLLQLAQAQVMALEDSRKLTERLVAQRSDLRHANEQLQNQNRVLQETEAQLRRSEAEARKLAIVASRTDNAVIVTDAEGRVEWVNEGFVRSTGYSLEEMRGKTPGKVLQGPRTDPKTVALMHENLRIGSGFRTEVLNYNKSGRPYWVAIEVQPVHDASGRVTNFMAIESDVTERRQHEQRRHLQHAVSRAITEAASLPEGIARAVRAVTQALGWNWGAFWKPLSAEGRLRCEDLWHDPAQDFAALCEGTRNRELEPGAELPGRCWAKSGMVWLKDIARDLDTLRAADAGRAGFHAALAYPCIADGKIVGILELYAFHGDALEESLVEGLDAACSQIGLFVVRELAEIAARRAGALQQAMFNSAAHALTAVTPEGVYLSFNTAAERLLGYRADDVVGRETPLLIHDPKELADRAAELARELGRPIEPGIEALLVRARMGFKDDRDWTLIRRNGTRVPVRLTITELRDEAGTLTGFLGSAVDLTDRREAEAAMREAKEAAEAANRAKSEFLATMSHEIRTPMNGVIGMTDLLQQTALTDRQRELTESIGNSASALLDVINDVLDFSRVEAGKLNISSETFVLRPLVDSVLEVASMRAPEKHLTLAAVIQPDLPRRFRGDPVRLRQILLNLVGNGVKFTEQGHVVVRVSTLLDPNRRLRVRFEVADSGSGLSETQTQQIFEPFVQVDSSSSRRFAGSGLGLAISRRLVELMDGRIGVTSRIGHGSTFWFELPLEPVPDTESPGVSQPLWTARFVAATADHALAESLDAQFRSWRLHASIVATLEEIAAQAHPPGRMPASPAILILDENILPPGATPPVPAQFAHRILLVSPLSPWLRQTAVPPGYRQLLLKPVKQSQLFDCLASALDGDGGTPRFTRSQFQSKVSSEKDLAPHRNLRILLVEDHRTNRRLCELMLEGLGLRAAVATNGREAVEATKKEPFDVILMDCHLPEMDGYEATRLIRAAESAATGPGSHTSYIVAVTANALLGERERCLDAGMDDYLTKPFTSKQLAAVLRRTPALTSGNGGTARAAAESGIPAFTPAQPRQMAEELGWDEFEGLTRDFLAELPTELDRLPVHLAQGARQELKRGAHSLKGISLTLGLTALADALLRLEKAAETANPGRLKQLIDALAAPAAAGEAALREWLHTGRTDGHPPG